MAIFDISIQAPWGLEVLEENLIFTIKFATAVVLICIPKSNPQHYLLLTAAISYFSKLLPKSIRTLVLLVTPSTIIYLQNFY